MKKIDWSKVVMYTLFTVILLFFIGLFIISLVGEIARHITWIRWAFGG